MSRVTYSRYFLNNTVKNYLEKRGYTFITGRKLFKMFKVSPEMIKQSVNFRTISRTRFCYKDNKEFEKLKVILSNTIIAEKDSINLHGFYSLYTRRIDYDPDSRLLNFRDVEVFKRLLNEVIDKELKSL